MIKINRFLVVGGDLRNLEIVKLLKEDGKEVFTYGINERESLEKIQENIDIIVGPIPFSRDGRIINSIFGESKILIEEFLKKIKEKILVAGNISSDVIKMAEKYNIKVIDIMKNEKLAILNTIATAEGTIELMISNTDTIIFDSNVLILGFGRVAKTLAQRLKGLVKSITCASREDEQLAWIEVCGYKKMELKVLENQINLEKINDLDMELGKFDIIVNTIPKRIFDEERLQNIKKETLLIDLASNPGGIDKKLAEKYNLKLIHALGLPGKVAPVSSAKYIKKVMYASI